LKVYRAALVRELKGYRDGFQGSADYEFALRIVERARAIRHIPKILYHWRAAPRSMALTSETKPESFESGRRAVVEAVQRRGIPAAAELPPFAQQARIGVYRLRFRDTGEVPITIIIPTKDKLSLLRDCIRSIESKTMHRAYHILIIDNDTREPEALDYLARSPHEVIRFGTGDIFNFSAMVNLGVARVETEYFVLLNNDTLVIAPDWLDEMLGYGMMPGVGAVGAKLLYADGRIQHALPDTFEPLEYLYYAHVARNYLAVTAACMLSNKTAFNAVGGFNERDLKVAWNDVDYCLRLHESGYRIVFNPYAALYHLESQTRGNDKDVSEIRYMMTHWRCYIDGDPCYNPNLSRRDSNFRIKTEVDEERHFFYLEFR
jgi:GT2 family glycosyltransferase